MPFHKGDGIPRTGRPKGTPNKFSIAALQKALKKVANSREDKKDILSHFCEQAYKDNAVLSCLMKKLLPDLKSFDAVIGLLNPGLNQVEAEQIKEKLMNRFEGKKDAPTQGP